MIKDITCHKTIFHMIILTIFRKIVHIEKTSIDNNNISNPVRVTYEKCMIQTITCFLLRLFPL